MKPFGRSIGLFETRFTIAMSRLRRDSFGYREVFRPYGIEAAMEGPFRHVERAVDKGAFE